MHGLAERLAVLGLAGLGFFLGVLTSAQVTSDIQMDCGACKGLFDEIDYIISKIPGYAAIDTGSGWAREEADGKEKKIKSYARSETHLYEVLETVCHEMENYSGFKEAGFTMYKRYQNRPEQKTPLKLRNFLWSVDTQARLRLSCDTIMNINEEEIVEAYMASTEVPYKKKLCGKFCKKAKMMHQLNAWDGLDILGKPLPEDETEYVNGMLKAGALAEKNRKEKIFHDRKMEALDKKKKREEAEKKKAEGGDTEEEEEKDDAPPALTEEEIWELTREEREMAQKSRNEF